MEKITIKIERAISVYCGPRRQPVAASSSRRSFQQSLQQTSDLKHNWQLQMQDGVFQALSLLIEVATIVLAGRHDANVY